MNQQTQTPDPIPGQKPRRASEWHAQLLNNEPEAPVVTMRRALSCSVVFQNSECGRGEFYAVPLISPVVGRRSVATIAANLRRNRHGLSVILNELTEARALEYWTGLK